MFHCFPISMSHLEQLIGLPGTGTERCLGPERDYSLPFPAISQGVSQHWGLASQASFSPVNANKHQDIAPGILAVMPCGGCGPLSRAPVWIRSARASGRIKEKCVRAEPVQLPPEVTAMTPVPPAWSQPPDRHNLNVTRNFQQDWRTFPC